MIRSILIAAMTATALSSPALAGEKKAPELSNPRHELLVGSAPQEIVTPVANGYTCFNRYTSQLRNHPVYSVGRITDQTGKFSNEQAAGGFEVTQGLANEVYSALGDLQGIRVSERSDTAIFDIDFNLTGRKLLANPNDPGHLEVARNFDGKAIVNPDGSPVMQTVGQGLYDYKRGQMVGVDYYITGAITGINSTISSGGFQVAVKQIGPQHRVYKLQVNLDLRIVDAHTLTVVRSVKESKIIRGYETDVGVFGFLGTDYLFDINAGKKGQEPIELGVRSAMESALLKLVGATVPTANGENFGETCAAYGNLTYGDVREAPSTPPPAVPAPFMPVQAPVPAPQLRPRVVSMAPIADPVGDLISTQAHKPAAKPALAKGTGAKAKALAKAKTTMVVAAK